MSLVSNELLPQLPQESRQQQSRAECADMSIYNEFVLKAVLLSDSRTELMAITDIYRACPIVYTSKCTHTVSVPHDESFWDNKPPFTHRTSWAGTSETDVPSRPGQAQPSPACPGPSCSVRSRLAPACRSQTEFPSCLMINFMCARTLTASIDLLHSTYETYVRDSEGQVGLQSTLTDPSARFLA